MSFMSSPKRAAKAVERTAVKRADKTAPRRQTVAAPAKPAANGASADAKRLAVTLERSIADGKLDLVSADALQKLIAAACRVYSARTEAGEQFTPVPKHSISATDVMLTASGLLRAADLAVFELGMWQSWTGR
jgi:4-hydroxy-L-threonine phosphate dehydrogenase PdxA